MMKVLQQLFSASGEARLSLVQGLLRRIQVLPTAALAGLVIMSFAWSGERHARRRDALGNQQMKKQAREEISWLQRQAAGAPQDAKQSAQAVRELEAQRRQFAREAEGLSQSLEPLRKKELARAVEVAALPTPEVVSRVASRLQKPVSGVREQESGQETSGPKILGPGNGGFIAGVHIR
jgi:hypothetical protein